MIRLQVLMCLQDGDCMYIEVSLSDSVLVLPQFHRHGVGRKMMAPLLERYLDFHQLMLTADGEAVDFYKSLGFVRAGRAEPMWIYAGKEH